MPNDLKDNLVDLLHFVLFCKTICIHCIHRVAKCRGYDEYIRVKIFAGWGKKVAIWPNLAFFGKICTIMQDFCV